MEDLFVNICKVDILTLFPISDSRTLRCVEKKKATTIDNVKKTLMSVSQVSHYSRSSAIIFNHF